MASRRGSAAEPGRWMSNLAECSQTPRGSPPATSGTIATVAVAPPARPGHIGASSTAYRIASRSHDEMSNPGLLLLGLAAWHGAAARQGTDTVIAVRGATIHTAAGAPIPNGILVVRGGKIVAVGANVPIPVGAKVYDAAGKHLVPGLVENHSHIGAKSNDLNDSPMVIGPQHRFIDALDLDDPDWKDAVEGGVTTIVTGTGSGEFVCGMAFVINNF